MSGRIHHYPLTVFQSSLICSVWKDLQILEMADTTFTQSSLKSTGVNGHMVLWHKQPTLSPASTTR